MKTRAGAFRKVMAAVLAVGLTMPALNTAAQADHRHYGYWKKHEHYWMKRKRAIRHWRMHHRHAHRQDRIHVVRRSAYPPARQPSLSGNTLLGGLLGAALGAAAGTQIGKGSGRTVAIIGGGLIGALIGGSLGQSMDQTDQYQVNQALETSPTGNTIVWQNPDTGGSYKVTPTKTYKVAENTYCREFTTWGMIGGYEEKMYGTACRQPDGSWKTVK